MKKLIVMLAATAFLVGSSLAFAGPNPFVFGADGKPKGCLCDIKGTVLMAQNEADCAKVGGKVVEALADTEAKDK